MSGGCTRLSTRRQPSILWRFPLVLDAQGLLLVVINCWLLFGTCWVCGYWTPFCHGSEIRSWVLEKRPSTSLIVSLSSGVATVPNSKDVHSLYTYSCHTYVYSLSEYCFNWEQGTRIVPLLLTDTVVTVIPHCENLLLSINITYRKISPSFWYIYLIYFPKRPKPRFLVQLASCSNGERG